MSTTIHSSAVVHPSAELAADVELGAYAIVEAGASLASGCRIAAHAIIRAHSVLGENVTVDSFASVGGLPQDLTFDPTTRSRVRIGAGSVIREGVTLHRSTLPDGETNIGADCLLMANSHVGHDCDLGDGVILANNAMLAGHVEVGSGSFLGGGCGIHQYVSIGELVMVAGNASVTYDVPSFVTVAERSIVTGLNLVGMKRKLSKAAISDLKTCYKAVYMKTGDPAKLAGDAIATTEEGQCFLDGFKTSRRGRFSRSRAQERKA